MNKWDEIEWSRLLDLASKSEYAKIVDALKERSLEQVLGFINLVQNQYGSIKRSNLVDEIEKTAIGEEC
jgi:hypothetical protein